jgi:predicted peroxiredoxin
MKNLHYLIVMLAFMTACSGRDASKDPAEVLQPVTDGVFIHVSESDPHRVLMALRMAEMMASDHDVMLYFDIEGIDVVLNDAEDITYAQFPSSQTQLEKLAEMGIPMQACPGCLQAAGRSADELIRGVTVADKETFFGFTKGRILTLDY